MSESLDFDVLKSFTALPDGATEHLRSTSELAENSDL
jgi:hypothetical protein